MQALAFPLLHALLSHAEELRSCCCLKSKGCLVSRYRQHKNTPFVVASRCTIIRANPQQQVWTYLYDAPILPGKQSEHPLAMHNTTHKVVSDIVGSASTGAQTITITIWPPFLKATGRSNSSKNSKSSRQSAPESPQDLAVPRVHIRRYVAQRHQQHLSRSVRIQTLLHPHAGGRHGH